MESGSLSGEGLPGPSPLACLKGETSTRGSAQLAPVEVSSERVAPETSAAMSCADASTVAVQGPYANRSSAVTVDCTLPE